LATTNYSSFFHLFSELLRLRLKSRPFHGHKSVNFAFDNAQTVTNKLDKSYNFVDHPNVLSVSTMSKFFKGVKEKTKKILDRDKSRSHPSSTTNPPPTTPEASSVTQPASTSPPAVPTHVSTSTQLPLSHPPPSTVAIADSVTLEASAPAETKSQDRTTIVMQVVAQILSVATAASAVFPPAQSAFGAASSTLNMVQVGVVNTFCALY
jgi:hypothetical protein